MNESPRPVILQLIPFIHFAISINSNQHDQFYSTHQVYRFYSTHKQGWFVSLVPACNHPNLPNPSPITGSHSSPVLPTPGPVVCVASVFTVLPPPNGWVYHRGELHLLFADNDLRFVVHATSVMPPVWSHDASTSSSSSSSHHSFSLRSLVPNLYSHIASHSSTPLPKPRRSLQPLANTIASVFRRQQQQPSVNPNVLPTTYSGLNDGPPPGTVVGVVIGSVCGFLLLLWLLYSCFNMGDAGVYEEEIVRRRSRSPRRSSRSRSEMTQQRGSPRRETRRETIIVEERRAPPVEREDDIVEVIEEHSRSRTPPRRERRGSDRRDDGYYRPVDPHAYAGGNAPARKVSRR